MTRIRGRKMACAAFLVCLGVAIAAPAQTYTTLASFDGNNGSAPLSPLVQGIDGNFYGVAGGGEVQGNCGGVGCGVVFKVTPTGTITKILSFCLHAPCTNGHVPSSLIQGDDGNFYGTTRFGGTNSDSTYCSSGCGTIFKVTPNGAWTTLYSFCALANCADGAEPLTLMQAFNGGVYGDFYGTTRFAGTTNQNPPVGGTVFRITPKGRLTTLYSFCALANCADGSQPNALIQTASGNFYGTTSAGGVGCDCGTVFEMTPADVLTTLHTFPGRAGAGPNPTLVQSGGSFYGTTQNGGSATSRCEFECGTIFKISSGGKLTILHVLCSESGCADGFNPTSGLIQATDGNFYGTDSTIYRITPSGTLTVLYAGGSQNSLVQGTDGKFYGTTPSGGSNNNGTVFSLDVGLAPFVSFLVSTGPVGKTVGILGQGFTGTTAVSFNGTSASFTVQSDTYLKTIVPAGATTGLVTVTTPGGTLLSNVAYRVTQ